MQCTVFFFLSPDLSSMMMMMMILILMTMIRTTTAVWRAHSPLLSSYYLLPRLSTGYIPCPLLPLRGVPYLSTVQYRTSDQFLSRMSERGRVKRKERTQNDAAIDRMGQRITAYRIITKVIMTSPGFFFYRDTFPLSLFSHSFSFFRPFSTYSSLALLATVCIY